MFSLSDDCEADECMERESNILVCHLRGRQFVPDNVEKYKQFRDSSKNKSIPMDELATSEEVITAAEFELIMNADSTDDHDEELYSSKTENNHISYILSEDT
jgi:hypothetical protein